MKLCCTRRRGSAVVTGCARARRVLPRRTQRTERCRSAGRGARRVTKQRTHQEENSGGGAWRAGSVARHCGGWPAFAAGPTRHAPRPTRGTPHAPRSTRPVTIARLQYDGGGDWYANPSSLPNLSRDPRADFARCRQGRSAGPHHGRYSGTIRSSMSPVTATFD